MQIRPYGNVLIKDIRKLESLLGFDLPKDYIEFLIKNNGGNGQGSYIYVEELQENIYIDIFYGVLLPQKALNILFWFDKLKDDMPKKSLVIGNALSSGFILLVNEEENYWEESIYYWDNSHHFPLSSDEDNCYFIAPTFTEFIGKIQVNTDDETV